MREEDSFETRLHRRTMVLGVIEIIIGIILLLGGLGFLVFMLSAGVVGRSLLWICGFSVVSGGISLFKGVRQIVRAGQQIADLHE